MEIEVKIDEKYKDTKLVIYTNQVNEDVSRIIDKISNIEKKILKCYKDEKMYIIKQLEIESIYSEDGKIYVRSENEIYTIKNRLYELEEMLDKENFVRISNSEIINLKKVKNIDFKLTGTILFNFISGNKAYVSRRYIQKIKEVLEV